MAQTNVPTDLTNVVEITTGYAGYWHSGALKGDGTVVVWGNYWSTTNVPATLSNVVAIASGYYHMLALKADGTVVTWGSNSEGQTNMPPSLTNMIAISANGYYCLGLMGDGPPVVRALLGNPTKDTNGLSVSLPTQSGRVYRMEFKSSLSESNWTALPLVAGNGAIAVLTDPTAINSQRFYRVRQW